MTRQVSNSQWCLQALVANECLQMTAKFLHQKADYVIVEYN